MRGTLAMASSGLAFNFVLWTVPVLVGAAALPHALFPDHTPTLAQALDSVERTAGPTPSLPDALVQLIGAESEAMHVAGVALQPNPPANLAQQANRAGGRVNE